MSEYEERRYDANNWKLSTKAPKNVLASRLYGVQKVKSVNTVMKTVPVGVLQSADGWSKVMAAMDAKFMPDDKARSWIAFDLWEDI